MIVKVIASFFMMRSIHLKMACVNGTWCKVGCNQMMQVRKVIASSSLGRICLQVETVRMNGNWCDKDILHVIKKVQVQVIM